MSRRWGYSEWLGRCKDCQQISYVTRNHNYDAPDRCKHCGENDTMTEADEEEIDLEYVLYLLNLKKDWYDYWSDRY